VPGSPATVGQVIYLYEQHRLMEIPGISTGRYGEIKRSLIEAKLVESDGKSVIKRRCIRAASVPYRHHPTCPGHLGQSEGHTIIRDQEALSTLEPVRTDQCRVRGRA